MPALSAPGVPNDIIDDLLDALVSACQVHQPLDGSLPSFRHEPAESSASLVKETHFSDIPFLGSTITVAERPRERFSYWCLDLLFISCHARPGDSSKSPRSPQYTV